MSSTASEEERAPESAPESETAAPPQNSNTEHRAADTHLEYRRKQVESLRGTTEYRQFSMSKMECRTLDDGTLRMSGYGSVTEHPYDIGDPKRGGFTEVIRRGAFKRTLSEDPAVVLLINHEGLPLASTRSGTLVLQEDARGLRWDADLDPNDPDSVALARKVERGLVEDCSFAFRTTDDSWSDDFTERAVKSVSIHKGDVSCVTFGASDATSVGLLRSSDGSVELRAGKTLSSANETALRNVLDLIAAADEAVDEAQPILAGVLGVPNPDADDAGDDESSEAESGARAAESEQEERKVVPIPIDYAKRQRERLAVLKGGHHR